MEGESIGKTWSNRYKESKPRDTIKCLRHLTTNSPTRDSKEMAKIAAQYHKEIQAADRNPQDQPDPPKLNAILEQVRARLPDETKHKLTEEITEEEICEAIRKSSNEKAPGLDGIPIEFWKSLDDQYLASKDGPPNKRKCNIIGILARVFRDIRDHGMDNTAKLNEGCMSPIYKKKDPENIVNYRPITLLNTDHKIFTKALSLRLVEAAPTIINADQAHWGQGYLETSDNILGTL